MSKHSKALIIESPGLQRPLPRNAWKLVTAIFWLMWFWIWLPIITVVGWAFGIHTVFDQFVTRWGYIELLRLLPYYMLVIGVSGVALVGWSLLQYHRFHGKERRKGYPDVTRAEIAIGLGLAEETTIPWEAARRMVAYHDDNGRVSWVEIGEAPEAGAPPSATVVALGSSIENANRESAEVSNAEVLAVIEGLSVPVAPKPAKRIKQVIAPLIVEEREALRDVNATARADLEPSLEKYASADTISRFSSGTDSHNYSLNAAENMAHSEEPTQSDEDDISLPIAVNAPGQPVRPRRKRRTLATAQARKAGHFSL